MLNVCVQHMICTVTGTFEYINLPDDIKLVSLFRSHPWWVGCVTDLSLASAFYAYSVFFIIGYSGVPWSLVSMQLTMLRS